MTTATYGMEQIAAQHADEVLSGERFEFGKNWSNFLALLDDERIAKAEESLREMLEIETLEGKTFLDIGSGSGLFSLAARRLGAKVFSFDYDTNSFACTSELRRRFFPNDENWTVEQGSALDKNYLESLGKFDIVYSWGVLHHTGKMWEALENAGTCVAENGKLFIAIYNDTGTQAKRWLAIKKLYNKMPKFLRAPMTVAVFTPQETKRFLRGVLKLKPFEAFQYWKNYKNGRGMNLWYDMVDWVGGYPYEFATPDEIFEFYKAKDYRLTKLKAGKIGLGCNEFVFEKG
jgi:2-polyprenyl-6-hydroxyphenyl methylase/3-demethylubiquinone-9 3-methyltransferase